MDSDRIKPEYIFPDYPRIDSVDLAWDMALAEKYYRDFGRELIRISHGYPFIADAELRQLNDDNQKWISLASDVVMELWFNNPDNPTVNQLRQEYFDKYDELETRGINPKAQLTLSELFEEKNVPFLAEWYKARHAEWQSELLQEEQQQAEQNPYEALTRYRYLRRNTMTPDEVSVRSMIFEDDPKREKPPVLKIDTETIVNIFCTPSPFKFNSGMLLLRRLGINIEPYKDYYSDSINVNNYDIENMEVSVVSPRTYEDLDWLHFLSPAKTKQTVKNDMKTLNQILQEKLA